MIKLAHFLIIAISMQVFSQDNPDEIVKRVDQVMMLEEGNIDMSIVDIKNGKIRTTMQVEVLYKKDKGTLMTFTSPAREKGKKILMVGTNMWMAVPGVSKAIRVSGKESFMGTSFSNNDLLDYDKENDYKSTITSQNDTFWILEMKATNPAVSYPRIIAKISKDYLPIKWELFTLSGNLIRVINFSEPKQLAGKLRPSVLTVQDMIAKGNETKVIMNSMEKRNVNEGLFSPQSLVR